MDLVAYARRLLSGRLAPFAAGLAGFTVFLGTLGHDFVFDDIRQILDNPWIWDARFLPSLLTRAVWSFVDGRSSNYYRLPLLALTLPRRHDGDEPSGMISAPRPLPTPLGRRRTLPRELGRALPVFGDTSRSISPYAPRRLGACGPGSCAPG